MMQRKALAAKQLDNIIIIIIITSGIQAAAADHPFFQWMDLELTVGPTCLVSVCGLLAVKTRLKHAGLSRDVSLKQILVGRHSN